MGAVFGPSRGRPHSSWASLSGFTERAEVFGPSRGRPHSSSVGSYSIQCTWNVFGPSRGRPHSSEQQQGDPRLWLLSLRPFTGPTPFKLVPNEHVPLVDQRSSALHGADPIEAGVSGRSPRRGCESSALHGADPIEATALVRLSPSLVVVFGPSRGRPH